MRPFLLVAALGGLPISAMPTSALHYQKRNVDINGVCLHTVVLVLIPYPLVLNSNWHAAYSKAKAALAEYTLEDKVNITTGVGWETGPCVGNIAAVGRSVASISPEC
jgi:hypothetical protein